MIIVTFRGNRNKLWILTFKKSDLSERTDLFALTRVGN